MTSGFPTMFRKAYNHLLCKLSSSRLWAVFMLMLCSGDGAVRLSVTSAWPKWGWRSPRAGISQMTVLTVGPPHGPNQAVTSFFLNFLSGRPSHRVWLPLPLLNSSRLCINKRIHGRGFCTRAVWKIMDFLGKCPDFYLNKGKKKEARWLIQASSHIVYKLIPSKCKSMELVVAWV